MTNTIGTHDHDAPPPIGFGRGCYACDEWAIRDRVTLLEAEGVRPDPATIRGVRAALIAESAAEEETRSLVADAAEAQDRFGDDDLERYAAEHGSVVGFAGQTDVDGSRFGVPPRHPFDNRRRYRLVAVDLPGDDEGRLVAEGLGYDDSAFDALIEYANHSIGLGIERVDATSAVTAGGSRIALEVVS